MIAALYVATNGAYYGLPNVDPWDAKRDARLYAGPWPVVAHPPCERWCQLAYIIQKRYGHKVGDDGGCFEAALRSVQTWGGVLEHPARTYAWREFGLPPPGGMTDWYSDDGRRWVTEVSQAAYGHRARKLTWLYYVGTNPPPLDWSRPRGEAWVSYCLNHNRGQVKPRLTKKQAKATPLAFRDLLISIAESARRTEAA
jgi:hypothetical protein